MRADHRLWRTDSGGLVPDGHPDARVLAYAPGDEVSSEDAARLAAPKAAAPASNKARKPAANKGR